MNSLGRGATFKEISKSIVEDIEIPLPKVDEQREIAVRFEKINHLTRLRIQQLAKLDELVKARFVEMFGNFKSYQVYAMFEMGHMIRHNTRAKVSLYLHPKISLLALLIFQIVI